MSKKDFEFGNIEETIFINEISKDVVFEIFSDENDGEMILYDFCVDKYGKIRKGQGFVSINEEDYNDPKYVPANAFTINSSEWNAHSFYFTIDLPNPFVDMDYSQKIRTAFLDEVNRRYKIQKRNAKARLKTKQKNINK